MAGVNKVLLLGHLGRDPDIRKTNAGGQVATFSIATSESWRDKTTGERMERTEWHNVVVFNDTLIEVAKALRKGVKVYVEGAQRTRKYKDRDGIERSITETVLAQFRGELVALPERSERGPPPDENAYGATRTRDPGGAAGAGIADDIPF